MRRFLERNRTVVIAVGGWTGLGLLAIGFVCVAVLMATVRPTFEGAVIADDAFAATAPTHRTPQTSEAPATLLGDAPSCKQDNCGNGCSVTCKPGERASCWCQQREKMDCGPFWQGPCYEYLPRCICEK